jgi:hypothetical protein
MKRLWFLAALLAAALVQAQAPVPVINQIGFANPAYPGTNVEIMGTGFTGATMVTLGTATDGVFTVVGDTVINYTVPFDAPPGGTLTVTTPGGAAAYVAPLVATKFTASPPLCLPNTGNVNTIFNPSTGTTIIGQWCDVATGTFHYAVGITSSNPSAGPANCLQGVAPFSLTLVWVQQAWNACTGAVMSPSDQAYANRIAYRFVPRPTVKGTGPGQTIFTTASNGGLGNPLLMGTPAVAQTLAGGTVVGGLRIPGGNVTRFCDVSTYTSDQGNVIPAPAYAACTLVYPPAGGFLYPLSPDKSVIKAPTDSWLVDNANNLWGIDAKGIITVNGIEDPTSAGVIELAFVSGLIWQENSNMLWWSKTSPSAAWLPSGGTATAPL